MRRLPLPFAVLCLSVSSVAGAQDVAHHPRVSDAVHVIELWLDAQRAYERIPGISAALVHDQETLWMGATGTADPEAGVEATPATAYSICSISKLFTSIAVMQLRDEGKLRLDDPVSTLLPWFRIGDPYQDGPTLTVESLLTHASGLPNETGSARSTAYPTDEVTSYPTREEIRARIPELEHRR